MLKDVHLNGWGSPLLLLLLLLLFYRLTKFRRKMEIVNIIYGKFINHGFSERLARYLVCQAAHETAEFKSALFKLNNNLFGMKQPKLRQTTSAGEKNGYAAFESMDKSITDMSLYLRSQGFKMDYKSIDEYISDLVKKRYFEAPVSEYTAGMKAFYDKYFA